MATLLWDQKVVLPFDFMEPGTNITSQVYCETLSKLGHDIQNQWRGILKPGIVFLYDNACPHTVFQTIKLTQKFWWDIFDHPSYSPDLVPSRKNWKLQCKTGWYLRRQNFMSRVWKILLHNIKSVCNEMTTT